MDRLRDRLGKAFAAVTQERVVRRKDRRQPDWFAFLRRRFTPIRSAARAIPVFRVNRPDRLYFRRCVFPGRKLVVNLVADRKSVV